MKDCGIVTPRIVRVNYLLPDIAEAGLSAWQSRCGTRRWVGQANPKGAVFGLVAANPAEIARLVARRLLAPLPVHNIPNTERQLPRFRQLPAIAGLAQASDEDAMPSTYSEMGLIYA